jgi:probable F420-dependent oxidoreductase
MPVMMRYGMTVPLDGVPLSEHRHVFEELADLGYTDVWSSEANGTDAFTPLALAAAWAPSLRLGSAIVPAFTRGPGLMAMSVAAMAEAAPGRFALGIGTSSNVIVENWNDLAFDEPYRRTRDMIRFLRQALTGERVEGEYATFKVKGFRLGRPLSPDLVPPILVAALRPGMLHLAASEGDGPIINWLSADDVKQVVAEVGPDREIVARIFVCPSEDTDRVRAMGRFAVAAYLNVPVYAAFHEWLGRGEILQDMWQAWRAGDRKTATAAIPDQVVDDLIVHGSPEACREHIDRYVTNGVTTVALALVGVQGDPRQAVRDLAPQ